MGRASLDPTAGKRIGAHVRKWRQSRGWSQKELGKALGLTYQQVHKYEDGANRVPVERMADIVRVFKLDPADVGELLFASDGAEIDTEGSRLALDIAHDIAKMPRPVQKAMASLMRAIVRKKSGDTAG